MERQAARPKQSGDRVNHLLTYRLPTKCLFLRKVLDDMLAAGRVVKAANRRQSLFCFLSMPGSSYLLARRPFHWKASAPEALPNTVTFGAQKTLPRLPVPALPDTLKRLKESLKPIAWSEDEYAAVEKKIAEFAAEKGPELQERLLKHAEGKDHWLEAWWDDAAYLSYRDSVRVFMLYEPLRTLSWSLRS